MTGTASREPACPYAELLDRVAIGDSSEDEHARLLAHVAGGCPSCGPAYEAHARFEQDLQAALRPIEGEIEGRRRIVLDALSETIKKEEEARTRRRIRRLGVRFTFFSIVLTTTLLLSVAYLAIPAVYKRVKDRKDHESLAKQEVRGLATALGTWANDHPGEPLPADAVALKNALEANRKDARRAYFDFDPARVRDGRFLDPFGRPYVYKRDLPRRALIRSVGFNGRDEGGNGDDIQIWVHKAR